LKVKVSQLEPCRKLLKIEIPKEVVEEELDKVYQDINKVAQIPGFRKGKAPRRILEQHHSKTAKDEILKKLIPSGYSKAIREHRIMPVSAPEIGQVKLIEDQPLYFEVTIDVEPEVKLKRYKDIKIKKRVPKTTDKDVEEALSNLRERYAEYKPIEDREIKEEDYVIVDYEAQVDNETVDKREKIWFHIKIDKNKPNEIIKNLIGAKIGDEVKAREQANKKALIKVNVKEIREKHIPKLDEEFIKTVGDYKSVDELKEALREDIKKRKEQEVKFEVENQLFDSLIKLNPLDVPPSMVRRQTDELVKSAKSRLMYQGLKEEDITSREETLRKNLAKEAEKQVKLYFILDRIAEEEDIKVNDEDLKERLDNIAKQNKTEPEKIKEYLTKNNSLNSLKSQINHEKVIDFLLNEAKIKVQRTGLKD